MRHKEGETVNGLEILSLQVQTQYLHKPLYYKTKCLKCGMVVTKGISYLRYGCSHCRGVIPDERIRRIFYGMKQRCYNSNIDNHKYWNGKGITICNEWLNNPMEFYNWSMENGYKDNLTIDRIDSNKNYCPENCQWITRNENSKRALFKRSSI